MKEKRNLMLFLPIIVFVMVFGIIYIINSSYAINPDDAINPDVADASAVAIPSGTVYEMTDKNIYSWHLITHNFNSFSSKNASGTKLIETKDNVDGKKRQAVVYCATEGKTLAQTSTRKRYPLNSSKVTTLNSTKKEKLNKVMPYMYPYFKLGASSNDANTLKNLLRNGNSAEGITALSESIYTNYKFDNLTAQEAITAVQAAIWNIEKGKTTAYYAYRGTIGYFSKFDSCSEFKTNKLITSEEETWYSEDGCNDETKTGKFYKFVVNHKKDSNTKNRINTLINWYLGLSNANITTPSPEFSITSSNFDVATKTMTLVVDTNLNDNYTLSFIDNLNNELVGTKSGNTYTITNISDNAKYITWKVNATGTKSNVYYYKATSGQDFIGLERGIFTDTGSIIIERTVEKGKIILYKVEAPGNGISVKKQSTSEFVEASCNGNCLSNAKFELYYDDENGHKELYKEIETDYSKDDSTGSYNNLESIVIDNLPTGTYYLKETQPAYGYDIYVNGTVITYDDSTTSQIGDDKFIKIVVNANDTIGVIVNNVKTNICFRKIDGTSGSNLLSHAVFQIQDVDGSVIEVFETSEQQTDGYCMNGQLQTGSYFLQEIKAPSGYSINTNRYHFTIGNGENDISSLEDLGDYVNISPVNGVITITDKKEVEISKSDATTGECVAGAELVIRDSNGEVVKDSNGVEIGRWISTCSEGSSGQSEEDYTCVNGYTDYDDSVEDDENEYICTGSELEKSKDSHKVSLPAGTYTLTETMTEELRKQGYSSESETITFTVDEDGKVADKIDMKDAPINVCIYKVSKNSKTPLAGAKFKLYNENDELVRTIETSSVESDNCISYIPFGTYTIKEIEAPSGYKAIDKEITIEIKDTKQKQEFYIENELVVPKTSLNTTNVLAIISIIFMAFGLGTVGYYVYKKKN